MSMLGKLMIPLALLSPLFIAVPAVSAAPAVTPTREIVRETITWTLRTGQCGELPEGVSVDGTGQRHMEIVTEKRADGSTKVTVDDVVIGTAVYSNKKNATYPFVYLNHSTEVRPASGTIQVQMQDLFVLDGRGRARLTVAFNWRWTYTPPETQWPPRHNVQKLSTQGDPLTCDPI